MLFVKLVPSASCLRVCEGRLLRRPSHTRRQEALGTSLAFRLFITEDMIQIIVDNTNNNINKVIKQHHQKVESDNYTFLEPTTYEEILALIGMHDVYRGLYNLCGHSTKILFSEERGLPFFGATMSRDRYQFLLSRIGFDNISTRKTRWEHDRFTAFREFFETFNDNCSKHVTPNDYMSLDETLYAMRHQIGFRQYNPDKPAKCGMLFKSINSAGCPYLHRSVVYAGKPEGEPNNYYNINII